MKGAKTEKMLRQNPEFGHFLRLPQGGEWETLRGEQYNCLTADPGKIGFKPIPWSEDECLQSQMSCACEYKRDPVVTLRGLCPQLYKELAVDSKFIPLQDRSNPLEFHWQGLRHSTLRLDASDKKWRLSSSVSKVSVSIAQHYISFLSGM